MNEWRHVHLSNNVSLKIKTYFISKFSIFIVFQGIFTSIFLIVGWLLMWGLKEEISRLYTRNFMSTRWYSIYIVYFCLLTFLSSSLITLLAKKNIALFSKKVSCLPPGKEYITVLEYPSVLEHATGS